MQRASQIYMQTKVTTTTQGDIVLMLYDAALKFIEQAKERLDANDMAGKGNCISRALDIVNELDSTLNVEKGGDLAKNLHNLYLFCSKHLLTANIRKDKGMLDEAANILSGLRSAFAAIVDMPEAQAAAQEAATLQQAQAQAPQRPQNGLQTGISAKTIQESAPQKSHAPMPGASVRMRTLYAQTAAQGRQASETPAATAPEAAFAPATGTAPADAAYTALPETPTTAIPAVGAFPAGGTTPVVGMPAAAQPPASTLPADPEPERQQAPAEPQEELTGIDELFPAPPPPMVAGFGAGRLSAYRKFAQQQ